jgi:hypothetical protein
MIRLTILAMFWAALALHAAPLDYTVSWLGNSFSGESNKRVQNFLIHTRVQPDGTVNTWSHWDEGGKKFGVYKDGDVIGNTNINPNSLETTDKAGHANGRSNSITSSPSIPRIRFQAPRHHLRRRSSRFPWPVRADGPRPSQ